MTGSSMHSVRSVTKLRKDTISIERLSDQLNCMGIRRMAISVCTVATGIVMTAPGISQRRGLENIDLKVTMTDVLLGGSRLNMFDSRQ